MDKYIYKLNDKIIYNNLIDNDIFTKYSRFPIASISKFMTVIILLKLKINLNLTVYDILIETNCNNIINSELIVKIFKKNPLLRYTKIIDIIRHKAGINSLFPFILPKEYNDNYLYNTNNISISSFMLKYLSKHNITISRLFYNKTYYYSTIGYILLGFLIECITGKSYLENLKQFIFIPCNMINSNIGEYDTELYTKQHIRLNKTFMQRLLTFGSSGGGICSCIQDLENFIHGLNNILTISDIEFLKENTIWLCENGNNYNGECLTCSTGNCDIDNFINNSININKNKIVIGGEYYNNNNNLKISVNGNFIGVKTNITYDFDNNFSISFNTCHTLPHNIKNMLLRK